MKRPAGAADPKDASKGVNLKTGKLGNEVLSPEQAAVCNFVEGGAGSAIITARAGSGKTWILIQALNRIRDDKKVLVLMFNKNTKDEFERDVKAKAPSRSLENVEIKTLNGFGHDLLQSSGKKYHLPKPDEASCALSLAKVLAEDGQKSTSDARALAQFAELIQNKLVPYHDAKAIAQLAKDFDLDVTNWILECVPQLFERKLVTITNQRKIDHTDQIWLPLEKGLICMEQYDWVFVDECQDLCTAQIALVKKAITKDRTRLLVVGDSAQSIYKFRGVINAVPELCRELDLSTALSLTTCFRCPKRHIELAKRIIPDICALPNAHDGVVEENLEEAIALKGVSGGHLVMARSNSALVKFAFALVRQGISTKIIGEEVLREMLEEKLAQHAGKSNQELLESLPAEEQQHTGRLFSTGNNREAPFATEMFSFIRSLASAKPAGNVNELLKAVKAVFDRGDVHDMEWGDSAVLCSTVHRAKGLTKRDAWILADSWTEHLKKSSVKFPVHHQEELNMLYIAVTRSTHALRLVGSSFSELHDAIVKTKK